MSCRSWLNRFTVMPVSVVEWNIIGARDTVSTRRLWKYSPDRLIVMMKSCHVPMRHAATAPTPSTA